MRCAKTPGGSPLEEFTDKGGRAIRICSYGSGPVVDNFEALVELYCSFEPATRTLRLPPPTESKIRKWLENVVDNHSAMTVAWSGTQAVGHSFLVRETPREYEMAVFVRDSYQRAGIGSRLVRSLLTVSQTEAVETVVVYVAALNRGAISFYRELGFTQVDEMGNAIKMETNVDGLRESQSGVAAETGDVC